jgi:uncharacterized protein
VIAAVFAAVLISVLSLRAAEVMIAFAPGSVDAMMLLALALNLDPVLCRRAPSHTYLFRIADYAASGAICALA